MRQTATFSAVITALLAGASTQAAIFYDTTAPGDWATTTNWSPIGTPAAGDWINVDQAMVVSSDQSFGDSTGTNTSTMGQYGLTINPGVSLTNVAGSTFTVNSNNNSWVGGGTFVNNGTYQQTFRGHIGSATDTLTFQNNGVYEQTAGNWTSVDTGSTLRMGAGSTYRTSGAGNYQLSGSGTVTSVDAGNVLQAVNFDVQSGTSLQITNSGSGQIKFATLNVASGSYLQFGSANMTYSSDNPNIFNVDGQIKIVSNFRAGSDLNFNPAEGLLWTGGALFTNGYTITMAAGNTATSNSGIYGDGTGGKFVNNGTFQFNFRPTLRDNVIFENNGLIDITSGAQFMNFDGTINNTATGSIVKAAGTNTANFDYNTLHNAIFINNGLVEVNSGTIGLNSHIDTTQFFDTARKTLTHGTWKIAPDTVGTATLTIGDASSPKITTIGQNATVILQNSGATFSYLDATLTTINGKLLVNGTKNLTNANIITVGSTGVIGGNGTYTTAGIVVNGTIAPGASAGTLTIASDLTLNDGSNWAIEIADPSGVAGTDWDLLNVSGSLTLPVTGTITLDIATLAAFPDADFNILIASAGSIANYNAGLFAFNYDTNAFAGTFDVEQQGNNLYLSYVVIPEPATVLLMAAGTLIVCLPRRRTNA